MDNGDMKISDLIQLLILIVYAIQLIVLVLGYIGIIRETNKNARERQKAIDEAGDKLQTIAHTSEEKLIRINKRTTVAMAAFAALAAIFLIVDRYRVKEGRNRLC